MKIISIQALQTKLALKPLLNVYLVTLEPKKTGNQYPETTPAICAHPPPPPQYIGQAAKKAH